MTLADVLLFDLGGVLVELSGVPTMHTWSGERYSDDELWHLWLHSASVRAFESGTITAPEFADRIVREMDLPVTPDEFLSAFQAWPSGLYPGAEQLLTRLRDHFHLACLSNTNELHWPRLQQEMKLQQLFHQHFPSHQLGLLKPDPEVFTHVLAVLDVMPERVIFFDDNQANVDGALRAGMQAHRVRGTAELRRCLAAQGI